jgi:hypothetical protein
MAAEYPQVGQSIRSEKALSKDSEAALKRGIEAYKSRAAAERPKAAAQ